jgi:hypothetical protein
VKNSKVIQRINLRAEEVQFQLISNFTNMAYLIEDRINVVELGLSDSDLPLNEKQTIM